MKSEKPYSIPVDRLTNNSIPTGLTLEYAAAKAIGIQDYDPQMIEALKDELDNPSDDIDSSAITNELERYKKVQFFVRKMRNEVSEWLSRGKETPLVIDHAAYQSEKELGPKIPDLDFDRTTFTVSSLYEWFTQYEIYIDEWSDETSKQNLKGESRQNKPRAIQAQKVENLHALVAILTDKVAEYALASGEPQSWLDKNGKVKKIEFAEYISTVGYSGLSDSSIASHITKGAQALKNAQPDRDKNNKKQPLGLKHLKF